MKLLQMFGGLVFLVQDTLWIIDFNAKVYFLLGSRLEILWLLLFWKCIKVLNRKPSQYALQKNFICMSTCSITIFAKNEKDFIFNIIIFTMVNFFYWRLKVQLFSSEITKSAWKNEKWMWLSLTWLIASVVKQTNLRKISN